MPVHSIRVLIAGCLLVGIPLHAQRKSAVVRCGLAAEFVDVVDRDTVSRSRVVLTDSSFESTSHDVAQGALVRYSGRLTSLGDIRALHIEIWPHVADSAGPPAQIADVSIEGPEVLARVAAPGRGVQTQRDRLPSGGVLYMTAAPLFLELLQRHVRIGIGASLAVPALWLFTGGHVDTVQVRRPSADSLMVKFPDVEYALTLASDRSIFSAATPATADAKASRLSRRDCH